MKKFNKILVSLLIIVMISISSFLVYTSIYYKADNMASNVLAEDNVEVVTEDLIYIEADQSSEEAFIFYPGAKVEYTAYLPLLKEIAEKVGINVILVKMPFNMAIFDWDRADDIIEMYPDINTWYIGGHSMGGAMASNYASKNPGKIEGLILMGAYIYGDYPPSNTLTIYGSLNQSVEDKIDYTENIVEIEGGNHAQFGNYGKQKGDSDGTITTEEQQRLTVEAVLEFVRN